MAVNFDFRGRVIAITGAASGIGLATAKLLAASGATLSLADVQSDVLKSVVSELEGVGEGKVIGQVVDVSKVGQVDEWINKTKATFGKLDGAANLAGVIGTDINRNTTHDLSENDWNFVTGINLTGVMHCLRAEMNAIEPFGSIVNAASIAGVIGFVKNASYTAAKHGVVGLTRSAAKEVGGQGIRVNCIAPGVIDTPMVNKYETTATRQEADDLMASAIKRKGQATEVANLIAWLLCDGSKYISGSVQAIDGAWAC